MVNRHRNTFYANSIKPTRLYGIRTPAQSPEKTTLFHAQAKVVRHLFGGFADSSDKRYKNLESVIIFTVSNKIIPC
jgi:hypothetical protein